MEAVWIRTAASGTVPDSANEVWSTGLEESEITSLLVDWFSAGGLSCIVLIEVSSTGTFERRRKELDGVELDWLEGAASREVDSCNCLRTDSLDREVEDWSAGRELAHTKSSAVVESLLLQFCIDELFSLVSELTDDNIDTGSTRSLGSTVSKSWKETRRCLLAAFLQALNALRMPQGECVGVERNADFRFIIDCTGESSWWPRQAISLLGRGVGVVSLWLRSELRQKSSIDGSLEAWAGGVESRTFQMPRKN